MKLIYKRIKGNVWLLYTCFFLFAALGVFLWHILYGKSFVWYIDGVDQYFRAFVYYAGYLRGLVKGLLSGQGLVSPHWEHALGEGEDFINVLHYYGVGDPFNLVSFLCPRRFLVYLFNFLIILRIYVAGIVFIFLCRDTLKGKPDIALATGAVTYALSTASLFFVTVHVILVNA